MRLEWFQVKEFQSVKDSGRVSVGNIACLVGKNEAGNSALLRALYRLNPISNTDGEFNATHDYPRMDVEDYREAVEREKRRVAVPISAGFSLDDEEIAEIHAIFGDKCISNYEVVVSKDYNNHLTVGMEVDSAKALDYVVKVADFSEQTREAISNIKR